MRTPYVHGLGNARTIGCVLAWARTRYVCLEDACPICLCSVWGTRAMFVCWGTGALSAVFWLGLVRAMYIWRMRVLSVCVLAGARALYMGRGAS